MKYIPIIAVENETGIANVPSSPIPKNALLVKSDGTQYIVYEEGDTIPLPPEPTASELHNARIIDLIQSLEAEQTPRRIRDAMLGTDEGWMHDLEERLSSLRSELI